MVVANIGDVIIGLSASLGGPCWPGGLGTSGRRCSASSTTGVRADRPENGWEILVNDEGCWTIIPILPLTRTEKRTD